METFQYVGKKPRTDLKTVLGTPVVVNEEEFSKKATEVFKAIFRDQVVKTVRASTNFFGNNGPYEQLEPQHGAADRLLEAIDHSSFQLVSAALASVEKDEFLCRVQIRVPIMPGFNDRLFAEKQTADTKTCALVSFYTGVCHDFAKLMKKNNLAEEISQPTDGEKVIQDEAFIPENVFPRFLENLRLERRYLYSLDKEKVTSNHFYKSLDGFIYRVEIDGYAAITPVDEFKIS